MDEKIAPVIPENLAKGTSGLVVDCPDHAIPFGVIFEEHAARRPEDLKLHAKRVFSCVLLADAFPGLQDWMSDRIAKYRGRRGQQGHDAFGVTADELEQLAKDRKANLSGVLSKEAQTELKGALAAFDTKYHRLAERNDDEAWPDAIDQFDDIAYQARDHLLPDPLKKLTDWLVDRNDTYHELARVKKEEPTTPPRVIDDLERKCFDFDRPLKRLLHRMSGSALCLSGGGIRSASFGLGVLEGLARFSLGQLPKTRQILDKPGPERVGLLHGIDYLSTVSGGGYIGSWLTAWVYRRWAAAIKPLSDALASTAAGLEQAQENLASVSKKAAPPSERKGAPGAPAPSSGATIQATPQSDPVQEAQTKLQDAKSRHIGSQAAFDQARGPCWRESYEEVVNALAGDGNFTSGDPEPQAVRHLRQYTSYLAPAMGLSLDSWDLAAIVSRNMLINWVMLAPLLLGLVALPQISYYFSHYLALYLQGWGAWITLLLVLGLFITAAIFAGTKLPSHRKASDRGPDGQSVLARFAGPVLLADWLVAELWYANRTAGSPSLSVVYFFVLVISLAGFSCTAWFLYRQYRDGMKKTSEWEGLKDRLLSTFFLMQGAALVSAFSTTLLLAMLGNIVLPQLAKSQATKISFSAFTELFLVVARREGLVKWVQSNAALFQFPVDGRLYAILGFPLVGLVLMVSHSFFPGCWEFSNRKKIASGCHVPLACNWQSSRPGSRLTP